MDVKKLKNIFRSERFFKSVVGQVRSVDGVAFHLNGTLDLSVKRLWENNHFRCLRAINPTSGNPLSQADGQLVDGTKLASDELRPLRGRCR